MTAADTLSLEAFATWLRQTDDHAEHHLALLDRIQQLESLDDSNGATQERLELAGKLERWRYQYLNENGLPSSEPTKDFLDALDLTANQMAGRRDRPPRATRLAVLDASLESESVGRAVDLLYSDAPNAMLEEEANALTLARFGIGSTGERDARQRMLLYAPLYVSSECVNHCTYCGFSYPQDIPRRHLSLDESIKQARILQSRGFASILIVGGDFPSRTTSAYYQQVARRLAEEGAEPSIEIASQSTSSYADLVAAGVCGLTLYQETYDLDRYTQYHVRGPKASYHWRLEAPDRAAEVGMERIGLGILLGLADPREDLRMMLRHARYLAQRFPDRTLAFSLPRIHEAPTDFQLPFSVSDDELVRMYAALRIAFPEAELVLSTREAPALRSRLADICITQMSAGSCTVPGGYSEGASTDGGQFPVSDHRSVDEVAASLDREGFHVCWSAKEAKQLA